LEMLARISDLVGAAFFFAILNLLLGFSSEGANAQRRHKTSTNSTRRRK
jgi:hypothetical protein